VKLEEVAEGDEPLGDEPGRVCVLVLVDRDLVLEKDAEGR
jgi:hypothetical protein